MEFGGFGDGVLVIVQRAASLRDGGVEIVDAVEMFVDERLIDEWPQVLGRLETRGCRTADRRCWASFSNPMGT
jgi:hypothetical protein